LIDDLLELCCLHFVFTGTFVVV